MTFFYDLNKKLADIAKKQEVTESIGSTSGFLEGSTGDYSAKKARAGKDIGKPGKMFSKIAKSAGERYGSKERGEKVAGAVLAKLRAKESVEEADDHKEMKLIRDLRAKGLSDKEIRKEIEKIKSGTSKHMPKESSMDENALQAYLGKKKYGETGMKALQKAGREGASKATMAKIRARHDKMDEAETDEGNAFTAKLKSTPKGGEFELDGKKYKDTSSIEEKKEPRSKGTAFDKEHMAKLQKEKEAETHSRYDVKDTGYSKRYTRKADPEDEQDDEVKTDAPKKKGRPAGTKRAIGAKGPTGRSKLMKKDAIKEEDGIPLVDKGEYDREGEMAKQQIHTIMRAAKKLHSMLGDDENLPEWVQKKITLAQNYIDGVADYMASQRAEAGDEMPIAEKAVSVAQRRAAGIAHAAKKGEIPKSELRGASKQMAKMPAGELKKFAKTKEKGLPKHVEEEGKPDFLDLDKDGNKTEPMKQAAKQSKEKKKDVDETTTSGSVAPVQNDTPKASKKGGFEFGKGVYESMDKKLSTLLNEGMNVSVNMNTGPDGQPSKNITVSADGDDAEALAALLKMAGIGGGGETCPSCGKSGCGCEELDENSPDWPTNTETSDDAMQYSGGLNGPKSTGQTTVPVIASQLRRQVSMEEGVELERSLFRLYQNYKAQ